MSSEDLDLISDMLARAQRDPSALRVILAEDIEWDVGAIQTIGDARDWQGPTA